MSNAAAITVRDLDRAEVSAVIENHVGDVFDTGQVAVTVPCYVNHDTEGVILRITSGGTGILTVSVDAGDNFPNKGALETTLPIASVTEGETTTITYQTKYIRLDDAIRHLTSGATYKGYFNLTLTPAESTTLVAWVECIKLNQPH